jgi:hypothetical protein
METQEMAARMVSAVVFSLHFFGKPYKPPILPGKKEGPKNLSRIAKQRRRWGEGML